MTNESVQDDGVAEPAGSGTGKGRVSGGAAPPSRNSDPLVWAGLFFLLLWTRFANPWVLVGASACLGVAALRHPVGWRLAISVILLGAGVVTGFHTEMQDRRLAADWPGYWEERREQVGGAGWSASSMPWWPPATRRSIVLRNWREPGSIPGR